MSAERIPKVRPKMDPMTERMLNLTLEIISLLTGESFPLMKSGDHMTITMPLCHSVKTMRSNMKKILEVTQKMMDLLTGEGGLDGDIVESRQSFSSWDPPEEATFDEQSPHCKEESLEGGNPPNDVLHPPINLTQHESGGIKEEPEGESVISPIMERPLLSDDGSPLHTDVSMAGDLLHLDMVAHYTQAQVKKELLVSDEGLDVPTPRLSALVSETSLEGEFMEGESVCFKWNVVDPQGAQTRKIQRPILPKPNRHVAIGKQFSCAVCGRSCRSKADLIQHCRVHSGEKPFQCSECGKCFSKQSSLAIHYRIHAGQKPYSCLECGKCFTSRSELTKHNRSHTGLKPYSCPECGKFFTCSSNLFRHKKIHTGEKHFICSECGKSFLTRSQMTIHLRVHTGEKPYPCSECSKCFVSSSDLAKHQRSHTGLKPHICPQCGKSYVSRSVLTRHQKIHTAEKRFFCAECGMGFVRTGKFLAHVKAHHRHRTLSRTPKLAARATPEPASRSHN